MCSEMSLMNFQPSQKDYLNPNALISNGLKVSGDQGFFFSKESNRVTQTSLMGVIIVLPSESDIRSPFPIHL